MWACLVLHYADLFMLWISPTKPSKYWDFAVMRPSVVSEVTGSLESGTKKEGEGERGEGISMISNASNSVIV